jgi:hypothetical protein
MCRIEPKCMWQPEHNIGSNDFIYNNYRDNKKSYVEDLLVFYPVKFKKQARRKYG